MRVDRETRARRQIHSALSLSTKEQRSRRQSCAPPKILVRLCESTLQRCLPLPFFLCTASACDAALATSCFSVRVLSCFSFPLVFPGGRPCDVARLSLHDSWSDFGHATFAAADRISRAADRAPHRSPGALYHKSPCRDSGRRRAAALRRPFRWSLAGGRPFRIEHQ